MSERFRFRFRVRYNECDAQLVVFNARYADYVDLAMTEFMRSLGRDYNALLARGLDNQVVKMTLEWQAPARFDDVIDVHVRTLKGQQLVHAGTRTGEGGRRHHTVPGGSGLCVDDHRTVRENHGAR